ncbi:MAG: response regulator [Filimonas sp.]|nr:response regulator [Filimonas sp.]
MKRKLYLLWCCAWCFFLPFNNTNAQTAPRHFRNISVDKGLSQSTVFTIAQDSLGFVWMATQDGLNRYNSESFTVYRPVKNDATSLQSYYIKSLFVDHNGKLWVGGNQGLSCYNYETNNFTNYAINRKPGEWYVSAIAEDDAHTIWAATYTGELLRLSADQKTFSIVPTDLLAKGAKYITHIAVWKNKLLIGTEAGFFQMDIGNSKLQQLNLGVAKPWINDVYIDGDTLWIGTEGNGIVCYDMSHGTVLHHYLYQADGNGLADNDVRGVEKDIRGNIWMGTFRGLSVLNTTTGRFQNYYHQSDVPYTISQNSVRCVFRDRQNGMWLGTYYGGVNYYHETDIQFNLLNQNTGTLSLNDQVVNVIKQDSKGDFWIGTNDKGLNYWNRTNNTIRYYTHSETNNNTISSNNIKAIAFDADGKIFIGTHNAGLNLFDPASGRNIVYRHNPADVASIAGDMVYALLKDQKNRVWVGTRSGLDRFDPATHTFTHIVTDRAGKRLSAPEITYLFEDSKGRIWIGTINSVTIWHPDDLSFEPIPGTTLSNDVINCIAEDDKNRIWIGTRDGLNLFDENKKQFVNFNEQKTFPKGSINGIQPGDDGYLWISTNTGLLRFSPDTKELQLFDTKDGLQNAQLNLYAFCKANDGMLLFGGTNGISYFYPASLKQQPLPLHITFTGLEVLNKVVAPGDGTGILNHHIDQSATLRFSHDYKQFTILFNTFNFISPNRTKYYYKLEGFEKDWQVTDNVPKVTYTNLQPGNYVFYVKAIGPQGEVSDVRCLQIVVVPVWYKSNWFYILLAIVIASVVFIAYRIHIERIHTRHQLKVERMEREKADLVNEVKMDFFTNVSHELRTPLTLILAPLEEIMRQPVQDKNLQKKHALMLANTQRLYHLVNQLFEFKKTEMGTRQLQVSKADLVAFVHTIYASFLPLAEKNNIRYTYQHEVTELVFFFDKDAIEHILFNLLSNAFKYTSSGNAVTVALMQEANGVVIKVRDTGKGIPATDLPHVFDRFYQVSGQEMNLGAGVGLAFTKSLTELHHGTIEVQSTPGEGTVFTVQLPLADEMYATDVHIETAESAAPFIPAMSEVAEETPVAVGNLSQDMQHRETLLIVDDNAAIVDYLQEFFGSKYKIQVAYNGKEALEQMKDAHPDLIISDVMMPEMDGLHFCKRIKQNIQTCHIPVVLLTAKSDTQQQIEGLEMGADDYITKPFSINLLDAKIANILRMRRRLKEYYAASKDVIPEKIAFNALDEAFIKRAIEIVEENIMDAEFSVEKLSREIGMSRSNLYLKMKAITGESVTDFIKKIRFKRAVALLETKEYNIAQVAYMSGFSSPSYFSTTFKQYYNCMPTEYVARLDENKEKDT